MFRFQASLQKTDPLRSEPGSNGAVLPAATSAPAAGAMAAGATDEEPRRFFGPSRSLVTGTDGEGGRMQRGVSWSPKWDVKTKADRGTWTSGEHLVTCS